MSNYLKTGISKVIGIGAEVVGLRKDGSTFPLDLGISEMVLGETRMFTGIIRDITERKHSDEETLRLSRVLNSSSNEIYLFENGGAIMYH